MAQILGGANFVSTRPYDYLFSRLTVEKTNSLAYRYGIQTLNILFEESHLDKVMDPSSGSFVVNNLIQSIIKNTWQSIMNWEERDLLKNAKDFAIEVSAIAKARREEVKLRKKVITGINNFANPDQTIESLYKKSWKPVELSFGHFPLRRLAYDFENLRINYEFCENKKKGLILTIGNLAQINARLNFVQNILDIVALDYDIKGIDEELSQAYDFLILVGQDEDYSQYIAKEFNASQKFIAGKKSKANIDRDDYQEVFNGMNVFELLENLLEEGGCND
jgi:methylmalonyl-CoA mutase